MHKNCRILTQNILQIPGSDSAGNAYTLAVGPTIGSELTQSIYYARNIYSATANANVVTVKYSSPAAWPDVRIMEYSGIDPMNAVDAIWLWGGMIRSRK
jgi:hypothetical protein